MIGEILLILLVALVVINPKRLPEMMYILGVCLARLQRLKQRVLKRYDDVFRV